MKSLGVVVALEQGFEKELESGSSILASVNGCPSVELFRDVETPGGYLPRIGWQTLAHHREHFPITKQAPAFAQVVEKFFARGPVLRHFDSVPVWGEVDCIENIASSFVQIALVGRVEYPVVVIESISGRRG